MGQSNRVGNDFICQLDTAVRNEVAAEIEPIVDRIRRAAEDLERALGEVGAASGASQSRARSPKGPGSRSPAKRVAKRTPRGTLQAVIRSALGGSSDAMRLAEIRDSLLADPRFRGRNPRALYTQIIHAIGLMQDIRKNESGLYTCDGE